MLLATLALPLKTAPSLKILVITLFFFYKNFQIKFYKKNVNIDVNQQGK